MEQVGFQDRSEGLKSGELALEDLGGSTRRILLSLDLADILWSRRTKRLNNVTLVLNKSWAKKLYGRWKRRERRRSNYQEIVIHTSPESKVWVCLIDTDGFYIDNGGFDPAVHRSPSNCSRKQELAFVQSRQHRNFLALG